MLFAFLGILTNDDAILTRTADVIQLNVQNADTTNTAQFTHKKGGAFKMSEAYTYLSMEAEVDLDYLLMDIGFFNRFLIDESGTLDSSINEGSKIKYKGISGY